MNEYAWLISPLITVIGLAVAFGALKNTINELAKDRDLHKKSLDELVRFMNHSEVSQKDEAKRLDAAFDRIDKKRVAIEGLRRDVDKKMTSQEARKEFVMRELFDQRFSSFESKFDQKIDLMNKNMSQRIDSLEENSHQVLKLLNDISASLSRS